MVNWKTQNIMLRCKYKMLNRHISHHNFTLWILNKTRYMLSKIDVRFRYIKIIFEFITLIEKLNTKTYELR